MYKKIVRFLNPMAHLGERKYSLKFPLLFSIGVYVLSEIFAYFVFRQPNQFGTPDVVLTFLLIIYFSFRSGIRGGMTAIFASIIFFAYFVIIRQAPAKEKEAAVFNVLLLTSLYIVIVLVLGWLRQHIDLLLDRERQARLLAEHEQRRLQALLEQLPVGVVIAQYPTGEIIKTNNKALKMLGRSSRSIRSVADYEMFTAYHKEKEIKAHDWPLAKALLKGKIIVGEEIRLMNNRSKEMTLLVNAAPITDKHGKITAAATTLNDITKQKELERQKDDFIAMASHELKTPLTSSKMYVQTVLKEVANNPRATTLMIKMNTQINRLTTLVATMLDTTRIGQGKLLFEKNPFLLTDTILDTVSDLQNTTGRSIVTKWQEGEYVLGDKERISQVFANLVTNAIKFSPADTDILVNAEKRDGNVIVSVRDFGKGIAKDEQKHIFDRFYQAKQHKTYAGLGLGLYISSEIVKQHDGAMWVTSSKGKGSTFYFSLPIYQK